MGKVVDEEQQPVAAAKVLIEFEGGVTRSFEVKTNDKGEYLQVGLPIGPYRITASKDGYVPGAIGIRVGMGTARDLPVIELISEAAAIKQAAPDAEAIKAKFASGCCAGPGRRPGRGRGGLQRGPGPEPGGRGGLPQPRLHLR